MTGSKHSNQIGKADRDLIALGIAASAVILFVATGSSVLPRAIEAVFAHGKTPDPLLVNALLLNVALIVFGWRRYRELRTEIAERHEAEKLARKLAEIDPLTQCHNRRSIVTEAQRIARWAEDNGEALAFCMIDLDNFKQINDMHGPVSYTHLTLPTIYSV